LPLLPMVLLLLFSERVRTFGATSVLRRLCGVTMPLYWKLQAKLSPSNGQDYDRFGASVDIYNDIIVVGAPWKAISNIQHRGRVYVFKRNADTETWTQVAGLQSSDGQADDEFGTSVAIYNNTIAVGTPYKDHSNFTNAGSVYVFRYTNNLWTQKTIIKATQPGSNYHFGFSVDLWGTVLLAGSPGAAINGIKNVGAALFFHNTDVDGISWLQYKEYQPMQKNDEALFGYSVAIKNNHFVIGGPAYSYMASHGGCVVHGTYTENSANAGIEELNEPDAWGGFSVALDDDSYYIGCPSANFQRGKVLVRKFDDNSYKRSVYNIDSDVPAKFGTSVGADGGNFAVGAPVYPYSTINFGSKY
jgi:hypothetical protein